MKSDEATATDSEHPSNPVNREEQNANKEEKKPAINKQAQRAENCRQAIHTTTETEANREQDHIASWRDGWDGRADVANH